MTSKEIFDKCIKEGGFITKKAIDKQNKRMLIGVRHPGTQEEGDWFSLEYSYKGNKPTQEDADNMYNSLISIFVKAQLLSYSRGQAIDPKGTNKIVDGVDKTR